MYANQWVRAILMHHEFFFSDGTSYWRFILEAKVYPFTILAEMTSCDVSTDSMSSLKKYLKQVSPFQMF